MTGASGSGRTKRTFLICNKGPPVAARKRGLIRGGAPTVDGRCVLSLSPPSHPARLYSPSFPFLSAVLDDALASRTLRLTPATSRLLLRTIPAGVEQHTYLHHSGTTATLPIPPFSYAVKAIPHPHPHPHARTHEDDQKEW